MICVKCNKEVEITVVHVIDKIGHENWTEDGEKIEMVCKECFDETLEDEDEDTSGTPQL